MIGLIIAVGWSVLLVVQELQHRRQLREIIDRTNALLDAEENLQALIDEFPARLRAAVDHEEERRQQRGRVIVFPTRGGAA